MTTTLPAVLTTYLFSLVYLKLTGNYSFFDSYLPIAVFLGMHLLFADPSTSPRTELGRIIFGIFYGLSVVGLYALLGWFGAPTFYDKLLQVPRDEPRGQGDRSLCAIGSAGVAGSSAAGRQPRAKVQSDDHSGWACNELGILGAIARANTLPPEQLLDRACALGFVAGCKNAQLLATGAAAFRRGEPMGRDYPALLRQGKGRLPDRTAFEVYTRACNQGWTAGCGGLAVFYLQGTGRPAGTSRGPWYSSSRPAPRAMRAVARTWD